MYRKFYKKENVSTWHHILYETYMRVDKNIESNSVQYDESKNGHKNEHVWEDKYRAHPSQDKYMQCSVRNMEYYFMIILRLQLLITLISMR